VCDAGDSLDDDAIVLCDGCDVAVHQTCYGITRLPKGHWFCAR
jgi:NuA3 HAT complex component NTO1